MIRVMTYGEAIDALNRKIRYRDQYTWGSGVKFWRADGYVDIRLWDHTIMKLWPDGVYEICPALGWETYSTKQRINWLSPIEIYQHKYRWFYEVIGENRGVNSGRYRRTFYAWRSGVPLKIVQHGYHGYKHLEKTPTLIDTNPQFYCEATGLSRFKDVHRYLEVHKIPEDSEKGKKILSQVFRRRIK